MNVKSVLYLISFITGKTAPNTNCHLREGEEGEHLIDINKLPIIQCTQIKLEYMIYYQNYFIHHEDILKYYI